MFDETNTDHGYNACYMDEYHWIAILSDGYIYNDNNIKKYKTLRNKNTCIYTINKRKHISKSVTKNMKRNRNNKFLN